MRLTLCLTTKLAFVVFALSHTAYAHTPSPALPNTAQEQSGLAATIQQIADEITQRGEAYDKLKELTDIGPRLSGSPGAEKAVAWAQQTMQAYGLDRVWLQPVTVPHWTRGEREEASLIDTNGNRIPLAVTALGGSRGTSANGLEAEVIEVKSLAEVAQRRAEVRGKIVFYNRPMDASLNDPFAAYAGAVDQRSAGAATAARYGAIAVLVRSMSLLPDDDHPHTGTINTASRNAGIPAAALSTHAANVLSSQLKANPRARVRLLLSAKLLADVRSFNVICETRGSLRPQEIVLVGGHLDSWDLGTGAHDDGAGVVQSLEILRAMKALGIKPKRTIRVVFFMAEELGGYGGVVYAQQAAQQGEKHVAAMESDRGGFAPVGFEVDANDRTIRQIQAWAPYLSPLSAGHITKGEGGTDIDPLGSQGVPLIGFVPEATHYFDIHHSALDRFEAVRRDDLLASAAAMGAMVYLLSEQDWP